MNVLETGDVKLFVGILSRIALSLMPKDMREG
jgi:hypothetical protein